jgi:chemotaxis regulatin CheY-phosphate phosphatase CheZ
MTETQPSAKRRRNREDSTMPQPNGLDEDAAAVQAGLATFFKGRSELDQAREANAELRRQLAETLTQLESLRSFNNLMESRINACIAERDQAVAERGQLLGFFSVIRASMDKFEIPSRDNQIDKPA